MENEQTTRCHAMEHDKQFRISGFDLEFEDSHCIITEELSPQIDTDLHKGSFCENPQKSADSETRNPKQQQPTVSSNSENSCPHIDADLYRAIFHENMRKYANSENQDLKFPIPRFMSQILRPSSCPEVHTSYSDIPYLKPPVSQLKSPFSLLTSYTSNSD